MCIGVLMFMMTSHEKFNRLIIFGESRAGSRHEWMQWRLGRPPFSVASSS